LPKVALFFALSLPPVSFPNSPVTTSVRSMGCGVAAVAKRSEKLIRVVRV
jgi:hypothetical protein